MVVIQCVKDSLCVYLLVYEAFSFFLILMMHDNGHVMGKLCMVYSDVMHGLCEVKDNVARLYFNFFDQSKHGLSIS